MLGEIALWVADESETFAGNLDDALAEAEFLGLRRFLGDGVFAGEVGFGIGSWAIVPAIVARSTFVAPAASATSTSAAAVVAMAVMAVIALLPFVAIGLFSAVLGIPLAFSFGPCRGRFWRGKMKMCGLGG